MNTNTEIEILDNATDITTQGAFSDTSLDNILYMADKADLYVDAVNRIMEAAIKITNEHDWTMISGKPYLQESGASKVSALFGISVEKREEPKKETDAEGYVGYTYKLRLHMNGRYVDSEGGRSMRDDFFCRKRGGIKKPDEIDEYAVKKSAYTNALVRGLKTLIPGLRNIDKTDLSKSGLDIDRIEGYEHKKNGETQHRNEESGAVCAVCGKAISDRVKKYSEEKFGKALCMDCQKESGNEQA